MAYTGTGTIRPLALIAQWVGLSLAATYAVNAMTRQDAQVHVREAVRSVTTSAGSGQFTRAITRPDCSGSRACREPTASRVGSASSPPGSLSR